MNAQAHRLLALCGLVLMMSITTAAQEGTGSLAGLVSDPEGGRFAAASVTATSERTKAVYRASSSSGGAFVIAGLPPETYELTVVVFGMRPHQRAVRVSAGEVVNVDVHLEDTLSLRTLGEDPVTIAASLKSRPPIPEGPTPRLKSGVPDLTGVWTPGLRAESLSTNGLPRRNPSRPRPWAAELVKERTANRSRDLPISRCLPLGVPLLAKNIVKLVHTAPVLIMMVEPDVPGFRQIFLDRREHPKDLNPTWQGHSIGRWEGDTLVIESVGFNDRGWLSAFGHPRTEMLKVTERLSRISLGRLDVEISLDDPGAYEVPWSVWQSYDLNPREEIQEYICNENNRDVEHLISK